MTLDEAQKVAAICATADGGCPVCVGALFEMLNEAFPEFSFDDGQDDDVWKVMERKP